MNCLPVEIIYHIIDYLPIVDIMALTLTSRYYHLLTISDYFWARLVKRDYDETPMDNNRLLYIDLHRSRNIPIVNGYVGDPYPFELERDKILTYIRLHKSDTYRTLINRVIELDLRSYGYYYLNFVDSDGKTLVSTLAPYSTNTPVINLAYIRVESYYH